MRTRLVAILLCAFSFSQFSEATAQSRQVLELTCQSLEQCLTLLQKPYPCMPDCPGGDRLDYGFIDEQGGYFSLPAQFEKFGRPGVQALLDLLKDDNFSIRARAGMVLSGLSTLIPADIPAIMEEARNGNGWIGTALTRIDTAEVLAELVPLLKKSPYLQAQNGWNLRSLGNEITPFLLESIACNSSRDCGAPFDRVVAEIVGGPTLVSDRIRARIRLINPATDRTQSQPRLTCSTLEHCLTLLKVPDPCVIDCADEEPPGYPFIDSDIGYFSLPPQFEKFGRPGVLALLALLEDPDLSIRARAGMVLSDIRTVTAADLPAILREVYAGNSWIELALMRIGTPEALSELRGSIERQTGYDRLVRIDRLGKKGPMAKSVAPYLVAKLHDDDWSTREEAAKALGNIQYQPAAPSLIASITPADWKLTLAAISSLKQFGLAEDRIREVAQNYWQPGIRAAAQRVLDGYPARSNAPFWSPINADCGGNVSRSGEKLAVHPDLTGATKAGTKIVVDGGTLFAIDEGEWGGALEFRSDDGSVQQPIKKESVSRVIKSKLGIFAITGSGHMGADDGFIYKVEKATDGNWKARIIWRLPAAPRGALVSPAGNLGIKTDLGDVIFRPQTGMEWISCVDWR